MRKIFNICILILLLFSTSGVAISKHYCGEILQNITFSGEKSCCEGVEMPEDCCKNEVDILKSDELKLSQHNLSFTFIPFVLYVLDDFLNVNIEDPNYKSFAFYQKAPPPTGQDILIRVQSFLL